MTYLFHLLIYFDIYLILALSLNLVAGYCGLLTVAHASYYAIGAYTYAILAVTLGWGLFPAMLVSILVAAVMSLAVSLPSWRLQTDFFFLATLVVQVLIFSSIYNWFDPQSPVGSWANLTNGTFGIADIPKPSVLGITLREPSQYVALATAAAAICGFLIWRLQSSPWGTALIALRDDELVIRGLGKNARLLKLQAIAFSCAFAAISGVLYAGYVSYVHPTLAALDESILMLAMVLVGGLGNFRGPIIGAASLIGLPELLRFAELPDAQAAQLRLMIYGASLIVLMHLRPSGLAGSYRLD